MLRKILAAYPDDSFVKADGFDEAIIGVEVDTMRLIYSQKKVIEILCRTMTPPDAYEHYSFNIEGSHVPAGPIWCDDDY